MRGRVLAGLLLGWLSTAPALAQPADAQDQEARALFEAGSAAYGQGEFERALDYFQRAHELSGRPQMLFNIGTTHDRLGDRESAIAHLRRYLSALPDADNRAFVERRLEVLEREPEQALPPVVPSAEISAGPIVLMAVGGATLLGAIGTGFWWLDRNEAVDACNLIGCANGPRLAGERDAAAGLTIGLGLASLAVLAAGVVWLVLNGDTSPSSETLSCSPTAGGLQCFGRF
ncbi:MAG: tol-pal system YbgF family protein [Sandaracinaceae bacterium]